MGVKSMEQLITTIVGAGTGLLVAVMGFPWQMLIIFAIVMLLDIITGIAKALKNGNWTSRKMKEGLLKKSVECIVLMAILLVQVAIMSIGIPVPLGSILVGAFIMKDFGSILENAMQMNVVVPDIIKKWFKIADDKINDEK